MRILARAILVLGLAFGVSCGGQDPESDDSVLDDPIDEAALRAMFQIRRVVGEAGDNTEVMTAPPNDNNAHVEKEVLLDTEGIKNAEMELDPLTGNPVIKLPTHIGASQGLCPRDGNPTRSMVSNSHQRRTISYGLIRKRMKDSVDNKIPFGLVYRTSLLANDCRSLVNGCLVGRN